MKYLKPIDYIKIIVGVFMLYVGYGILYTFMG